MDRNEQNAGTEKPKLSPLAQEKTYGEKKFDFLFGNVLNFWVNLVASAGFTFFVNHAGSGVFKTIRDKQEQWTESLSKQSWVRTEGNIEASQRQAKSIINVLTLLTPGHLVMIPSVWLGEKFKAPIVKYWDRKHYGDEAMDNPELKARHDAIATAEKPTFIGTLAGRAGGAMVNIGISRLIGSQENYISKAGKKYNNPSAEGFAGIDATADSFGKHGGEALAKIAPRPTGWMNKLLSKNNTYSSDQITAWNNGVKSGADLTKLVDVTKPYNLGFDNFSRYLVQDVMYTISTAAFVKPIVMGLRHILPGMTYKVPPTPDMDMERVAQINHIPNKNTIHDEAPQTALTSEAPAVEYSSEKPSHQISHAHHHATITDKQHSITHAG